MVFSGSLVERGDDLRFRSPQSPRDEQPFPNFASPLRSIGSQIQPRASFSTDIRGSLPRRFTTNTVPTLSTKLSPIGQERRQAAESIEAETATFHKVKLELEQKTQEVEYLREQQRRFTELLEMQNQPERDNYQRLSGHMNRYNLPQSEPTTPPEYHTTALPSFLPMSTRSARFSSASMASPPGVLTRPARAGSQVTSPPTFSNPTSHHHPSKSVPGSRRGSDEDEAPNDYEISKAAATAAGYNRVNRISMPVTGLDHRSIAELPDVSTVLGGIDTTKYLFGNEDNAGQPLSPRGQARLSMKVNRDGFPTLRSDDMHLSTQGVALDLATTPSPNPEQQNGWGFTRHRPMPSLPTNAFSQTFPPETTRSRHDSTVETTPKSNRHSLEAKFSPFGSEAQLANLQRTPTGGVSNGMPKLQASYSTNDIPTLKNVNGSNGFPSSHPSSVNNHAEQHFHNHNASLGRIPPNAASKTHSRELSGGEENSFRGINSVLHASAAPFGPTLTSPSTTGSNGGVPLAKPVTSSATSPNAVAPVQPTVQQQQEITAVQYRGPPVIPNPISQYYNQLAMANLGMNGMQFGVPWGGSPQLYSSYGQFSSQGYQNYPQPTGSRFSADSQARIIQSRRTQTSDNDSRFANFDLKLRREEIYGLCKDQHGCRFLQKRLEDGNPETLQIIFEETNSHVVELMTDSFGNYLCQKLLEYTNDDQRTILINNASPRMVKIALDTHGTRALQKMIEFVSTPQQVQTIIRSLKDHVINLIQDLNGNHVIQKCLNHLKHENAQFIFDAVGEACVIVGTHRHGCCVLQRCIDHASPSQRAYLVSQITKHSVVLVQDAFGNYVVQYVLDLNEQAFTRPICAGFLGKISELSRQKFSSNVIEKCIRMSDMDTKRMMIEELLRPEDLEKLLRDSYANYVMQTALEFAPDDLCAGLIESIRPILPSIRQTPYGRRIQSKVQERENRLSLQAGASAQAPFYNAPLPLANNYQRTEGPYATMGNGYSNEIASPRPHRLSNPPLPNQLQNSVQQQGFPAYGRGGQGNGPGSYY